MTRISACLTALLILAACGGGPTTTPGRSGGTQNMFATGPIYSACKSGGRKQATRARCGCVQAVANISLSPDDQRRGAGFFKDPHRAQEVRQSNVRRDERFWIRWKAYSDEAARICT